jgi:16S rRNA (cytosine1402-N4)-methyltransferase
MNAFNHISVMKDEVVAAIQPKDREVYVDGTLGGAGYALAVLGKAKCKVIGIDRDPAAIEHAKNLHPRLSVIKGCFGDLSTLIDEKVDGLMLDLGVSSVQIDTPERGFSFRFDGPLDMRMSDEGLTASDIVNDYEENALANLIYKYGEEKKSRHIAAAIVKKRAEHKIVTTYQLADIIRSVVWKSPKDKQDPATRTFQALRIAVNDELRELERALAAAIYILKPGGRLVVVTFHSLEDSIVKTFMRSQSGNNPNASRYEPVSANQNNKPFFALVTRKAITPSDAEIRNNPRARSAKLRCVIRTDRDI